MEHCKFPKEYLCCDIMIWCIFIFVCLTVLLTVGWVYYSCYCSVNIFSFPKKFNRRSLIISFIFYVDIRADQYDNWRKAWNTMCIWTTENLNGITIFKKDVLNWETGSCMFLKLASKFFWHIIHLHVILLCICWNFVFCCLVCTI